MDGAMRNHFKLASWLAAIIGLLVSSAFSQESKPSSASALDELSHWLSQSRTERTALTNLPFAQTALTKSEALAATQALWRDRLNWLRAARAKEMQAKEIDLDGLKMKFAWLSFGDSNAIPAGGRSLFISMHGGGGTTREVNDQQWTNQIRLGKSYAPTEGLYVAPRAPNDAWDMWHQAHIDEFFARLIEDFVALEHANPNRVYLMGYSAGGDGVYQLAPRMADRWAAAAMMAGHPNDASPLGLRNVPFAIQVGALDSAYHRNEVAAEWGRKLDGLEAADPEGYVHFTELHAGKGHWMDLEDRKAVPWMEKFTRNPLPDKVVWHQDDVTHTRFYWLARPKDEVKAGQELVAERAGQIITLASTNVTTVTVLLNDALLDLDEPVIIQADGLTLYSNVVPRRLACLEKTLSDSGDPQLAFSAAVTVTLPSASAHWWSPAAEVALQNAGTNATQLRLALDQVPESHRAGMDFLIANMPPPDRKVLSANYLLTNTALAYEAINSAPWRQQISPELFLNDILPYAVMNETRDDWRARLRELCLPLVRDCQTPGEAAMALNQKLFGLVNVHYSTKRERADQSALESMKSGLASCTGLTILLVDACRSVGVPARFAGTPMWMNGRGNHSWTEIWDNGWHFIGSAEPDKAGLDHAWFVGDAAQARADQAEHAIYASSFARTGVSFPLDWAANIDWVNAVNVTGRYAKPAKVASEKVRLLIQVLGSDGKRVEASVTVVDPANPEKKLQGESRNETADLNNILSFDWPAGAICKIDVDRAGHHLEKTVTAQANGEQTVVVQFTN